MGLEDLPSHPYFPESLILSGGKYVANTWDVATLITIFFAGFAAIMSFTFMIAMNVNENLRKRDVGLVMWFVLCGWIHLFFEGYFMLNHHHMASKTDFFGQLWKEYALSDSRYMASDPFVLCMESWTAIFWGPLSFLTALLILIDSPYRYPIQAFVSTGQFYGDILYYTTSLFDDLYRQQRHYRPEPYYFWFYFVFMNGAWIVIPLCCLFSSIKATANSFAISQKVERTKKVQ
ncbi:related to emopamil-binding protein [Rhynchosporium secalis]|uniref:Related to emopamil-binding protein n=1 Tax=Rhynchosporium secalis TaxID=38038 RepID=A0A1E1MJ00_RHYSE|nr:related to emopamil-binding protein [Rhynchosporium secalis]